jgi:hypothetical protein
VFVQVGAAAFVLMAFNVFVLDYGMMWVARGQAQNAADAGALAGAIARGYDDFDDPPHPAWVVGQSAEGVAAANLIWQQPGTPQVSFDCPPGVTGRCVQVDVYRNGEFGSTRLPTLFGPILGVTHQGVRATATGIAGNGNASNCVRPIAFADAWNEENAAPADEFNRYIETGPTAGDLLPGPRDVYTAPSATQAVSAVVPHDLGYRVIWQLDQPITAPITRWFLVPLRLPVGTFDDNLRTCSGQMVQLRQTLPVETSVHAGLTNTTLQDIIDQDPGVTWDPVNSRIGDSCAPGCAAISPRLVPIVLFDPDKFQRGRATNNWTQPDVGCPTNHPCVTVTNIVGFFVHGPTAEYPDHGHLLKYPGRSVSTAPTFVDEGSWLVTTHLVR